MSKQALLGFLVFINILNFVDRQLIASFGPDIKQDLDLTNLQFGLVTGLAFTFFYAIAGLAMGSLIDTGNRPRLLAMGLAVWSAFTALTGKATSFITIALPRMFIGVGESIQTPASISMLADKFPASAMGFVSGIYYMGVPIGVGVSLLIVGYLGPAIGWQNCFFMMGGLGLLAAAGLYVSVPENPARLEQIRQRKEQPGNRFDEIKLVVADLWQALKENAALKWTIAGGVITHFVLGASQFDQLWLVNELGFDKTEIALRSGYIILVFGALGNIVGGYGSDFFLQRMRSSRPMFLAIVQLIIVPVTLLYRLSDADSVLIWVGLIAGAFGLGAIYGPTIATVQELAPNKAKATAIALYILLLNLVGLGVGTLAMGLLADVLVAAEYDKPYTIALTVLTVISGLSIITFYLAHRHYRRALKGS